MAMLCCAYVCDVWLWLCVVVLQVLKKNVKKEEEAQRREEQLARKRENARLVEEENARMEKELSTKAKKVTQYGG